MDVDEARREDQSVAVDDGFARGCAKTVDGGDDAVADVDVERLQGAATTVGNPRADDDQCGSSLCAQVRTHESDNDDDSDEGDVTKERGHSSPV